VASCRNHGLPSGLIAAGATCWKDYKSTWTNSSLEKTKDFQQRIKFDSGLLSGEHQFARRILANQNSQ